MFLEDFFSWFETNPVVGFDIKERITYDPDALYFSESSLYMSSGLFHKIEAQLINLVGESRLKAALAEEETLATYQGKYSISTVLRNNDGQPFQKENDEIRLGEVLPRWRGTNPRTSLS